MTHFLKNTAVLGLFSLCLGFPTVYPAARAAEIKGQILVQARPKTMTALVPAAYQAVCGKTKELPVFQIRSDGAVRNAVVWLDSVAAEGFDFPPIAEWAKKAYRLDQTLCEFKPHVLLAAIDTPIYMTNSDPLAHNIGLSAAGKALANVVLPDKGSALKKVFRQPGPHRVQCGIHPWMSAIVFVQKHPLYVVTGEDGRFSFEGLPNGKYRLQVWHEGLGSADKMVSETSGEIRIVYPGPARRA